MSLDEVQLVSDVLHTCTVHALTTCSEEVMGILLGDIITREDGKSVGRIWRALPQIRTDRRKDRVEPSLQQLSDCISKADELTVKTGNITRVIGWYHSHPNITVQPSHVDLRTQAQHQTLDSGFIGLIFSCFNQSQVIQCTAFQAVVPGQVHHSPNSADRRSQRTGNYGEDEDLKMAISVSLAEFNAKHSAPNSSELRQKEIPLKIVQPRQPFEYSLMDCANLHNILFKEEHQTYEKATKIQTHVSNLVRLHQSSVYYQSLLQLMNGVFVPNLNALISLRQQNSVNLRQLTDQIDYYKALHAKQSQRDEATLSQLIDDTVSLSPTELLDIYDKDRDKCGSRELGDGQNYYKDTTSRRNDFMNVTHAIQPYRRQDMLQELHSVPEYLNNTRPQGPCVGGPPLLPSGTYNQSYRSDCSSYESPSVAAVNGSSNSLESLFSKERIVDMAPERLLSNEEEKFPNYGVAEPDKHIAMRHPSGQFKASSSEKLSPARLQQPPMNKPGPGEHQSRTSSVAPQSDIMPPGGQYVPFVSYDLPLPVEPRTSESGHAPAGTYAPLRPNPTGSDRRQSVSTDYSQPISAIGVPALQAPPTGTTACSAPPRRTQTAGFGGLLQPPLRRQPVNQETDRTETRLRTNRIGEITNISVPRIQENDDYAETSKPAYRPQRK